MSESKLLEKRIADALTGAGTKAEAKRMFGGVAFMVKGHMSLGITNKGDLMARFDPSRHEEILEWPGAKPMTYGHGNMKGFLFVEPAALGDKRSLDRWVKLSLEHIGRLPSKALKATKGAKKAVAAKKAKKSRSANR